MAKIIVTTDSTADLTKQMYEDMSIPILPLVVNLGSESYIDGVNITPQDIFAFVSKTKVLPKTAARSISDFADFFTKYTSQGYEVIHIGISSELSVSYSNAIASAQELKGVHIIDGKNLSTGTALLVLRARELVEQGLSAEQIVSQITDKVSKVCTSFVVDTLDYLHKGGRCSALASFMATALKLKPTIIVRDGKMIVGKKYMGKLEKGVIAKYIRETIQANGTPDYGRVFITHSSCLPEMVDCARSELSKYPFAEIIETVAGATITSHCGKGTLGILFFRE